MVRARVRVTERVRARMVRVRVTRLEFTVRVNL